MSQVLVDISLSTVLSCLLHVLDTVLKFIPQSGKFPEGCNFRIMIIVNYFGNKFSDKHHNQHFMEIYGLAKAGEDFCASSGHGLCNELRHT